MTIKELKKNLSKYNENENINVGIVDAKTGMFHRLEIYEVFHEEGFTGIELCENREYIKDKIDAALDEFYDGIREHHNSFIDAYIENEYPSQED